MVIKDIVRNNLGEIVEIYKGRGGENITHTAQLFCEKHNYKYTDSWRRLISEVMKSTEGEGADEEVQLASPMKVLVFDLETAPASSYIWQAWNQNPGANLDMIQSDWFVLTWSAKWLFEGEVFHAKLTPEEAIAQDDSRIMRSLWELFNEAQVVIAHNALKFDIKKANTRWLAAGLTPPLPYQVVDTLVHARKRFSMLSNRLDYLARFFGIEGKLKHEGFKMWDKAYKGDPQALDDMSRYNDQDVWLLEEVYLKMRAWIKPHPNVGLYISDEVSRCATCGSDDLHWEGQYATYVNTFDAYRCNCCGSIGRSRKTNVPAGVKKALTISTPN